jgi:exopolysaccharide biosynthesis operon protein EpsL
MLLTLNKQLLLLLGIVAAAPVGAGPLGDNIHPYLAVTRSYDANLFRLDENAAGFQGQRSDNLTQTQYGVVFDVPVSRQRLTGQIKQSRVQFEHFDQLDYSGKDYLADLEWHIGNHLEGHLGASYAETLTSFNDFHSAERNLRVQHREYADGAWTFHPSFRVRTALSTQKSTYDLPEQQFNDRTEDQVVLGVDYMPHSGSRVGLQVSQLKGKYPNHRLLGGIAIDDGYTQNEVKANVYWVFSATSQFTMLAGWAQREHSFFEERDSSGVNGRATMNWSMLRKLRMSASAWREFAPVESTFVNNSLNKGVGFNTTWDVSSKVNATAAVRHEERDFSTLEGRIVPPDFHDTTRNASLGLTYAPIRPVQLSANVFHEKRSGNASTNYRTHGVSVNASIQY